ncbi:MAG: polysaccharide deacetylase family protein, partial [bacterium]|nr:polysaccharide deacetylase family protein [bacterium]
MPVVSKEHGQDALRAILVGIVLAIFIYGFWLASETPSFGVFGRAVTSEPERQKVVALTFDDGPNPPYTGEIVGWLHAHGAVATFFCVGRAVQRYPDAVRAEV